MQVEVSRWPESNPKYQQTCKLWEASSNRCINSLVTLCSWCYVCLECMRNDAFGLYDLSDRCVFIMCCVLCVQLMTDFESRTSRTLLFEIEPGTFLTANAGILLCSVQVKGHMREVI
jgi:hypothetical protein